MIRRMLVEQSLVQVVDFVDLTLEEGEEVQWTAVEQMVVAFRLVKLVGWSYAGIVKNEMQ